MCYVSTPDQSKPPGRPEQRQRFLSGAVKHALEGGISTLSLRPLASRLGTSDRMLLYYFGTRDNLVVEVLDAVSRQLEQMLGDERPVARMSASALLAEVWTKVTDPSLDAALRLYLEVDVLAARGVEPYSTVARRVSDGWRAWLGERLDDPPRRRHAAASALLAVLDGLLVQRLCVDPDGADQAARWLSATLG